VNRKEGPGAVDYTEEGDGGRASGRKRSSSGSWFEAAAGTLEKEQEGKKPQTEEKGGKLVRGSNCNPNEITRSQT